MLRRLEKKGSSMTLAPLKTGNNESTRSFENTASPRNVQPPGQQAPQGDAAAAPAKPTGPPGLPPGVIGDNFEFPSGLKLFLIVLSVFIAVFLTSLDRLILATAIPAITDEFDSLSDVGWYGSAYLLTTCAFQLLFGKIYAFFDIKNVLLFSISLFEAGSLICGAAPNSVVFIVGRAVQGIGAAGIYAGTIVTIAYTVPLHKRPLFQGLFGAVFGVASVLGPLIGGVFTTSLTWRWCFYINLPIGGVSLALIFFLLKVPDRLSTKIPLKAKLKQLDFPGTSVLVPGTIALLLALQWGGVTFSWADGRIIGLFVTAGVLLAGFIFIQGWLPKTATIPPRIFKQRSVVSAFWASLFLGSQTVIFVYFLPIWFQSIQGATAVESGVRTLPLTLSQVFASIATGILVSKIGYYAPTMIIGTVIMIIGTGLLTTFEVDTGAAKYITYQIIYGFGMGMCFQAPNLAIQTVLPRQDVPIGSSLLLFITVLGGAIFLSVGQTIFNNELFRRLADVPGFSPSWITEGGLTDLQRTLNPEQLKLAMVAYNESLRMVFYLGLILASLTIIGSATIEWRSVKQTQPGSGGNTPSDMEKGSAGAAAGAPDATNAAKPPMTAVSDDNDTLADTPSGSPIMLQTFPKAETRDFKRISFYPSQSPILGDMPYSFREIELNLGDRSDDSRLRPPEPHYHRCDHCGR